MKFANDDTDLKSAFYWLNRAAANGSVVAMKNLAMMHEKGIGTPANAEESRNGAPSTKRRTRRNWLQRKRNKLQF